MKNPTLCYLILLSLCVIHSYAATSQAKATADRLQIPIVPYARIGKIFDKRRDALGSSVLSEKFDPEKHLVSVDYQSTVTRYKFVETNKDATDLLNIDGSASLQLELGLVQGGASGAGGYLKSIDDRDNFAELLFSTTIQKDTKNLANNEAIDGDKCKNSVLRGTHIITGIMYGATCIVSVRIKTEDAKKKQDIKGKIKGSIGLSNNKFDVAAEGQMKKVTDTLNSMSNVTVYTFCNVELDSFPTTAEEGILLAKEFPEKFKARIPDGVPIKMELTPIDEIQPCGRKSGWKSDNLLDSYFGETVEMVQDLKTAYKRLWSCMEILVSSDNPNDNKIKFEAKDLRDSMKVVNYKMKEFIDSVDYTQDNEQFKKVKDLYTNNEKIGKTDTYGKQFWKNKVNETCKKLATLKPQKDNTNLIMEKACSMKPDLISSKKEEITSTSTSQTMKGHDGDVGTCYNVKGSDSKPAVWTAKLTQFSRNLTAIEIFFKIPTENDLGDVDVYISQLDTDFVSSARPKTMYRVGALEISHLQKDIGIKAKATAIRGDMVGNSGYVSVIRLESTKRLVLCEVKVKGQLCPTRV